MAVMGGTLPAPKGRLSVVHYRAEDMRRDFVRDEIHGHYRREREPLLLHRQVRAVPVQQRLLRWLRDHIHPDLPRAYYKLVLGHDSHISMHAALYMQHFHATFRDPWTGELGWLENVGCVSEKKVTTAFRNFLIDMLVTDTTEMGDFKFHEVGTSAAAEANTQTTLTTSTGIARATGTQVEAAADIYRSVGVVTADTTETWQEHGLFSQSTGGTMMDRNLISPTASVVASDTVTFTYELTLVAEA